MQFLLAQLIFRKNPKAAAKTLDQTISDAQTFVLNRFCIMSSLTLSLDINITLGSMLLDFYELRSHWIWEPWQKATQQSKTCKL